MSTTDTGDPEHSRSPATTFALETLGCKLNQAESESLARKLIETGYTLVGPNERPDVYVLNSCTVTHVADRKSRQALRAFRRHNPDALVVALGCYAARSPQELSRIDGVDVVIPDGDRQRVVERIVDRAKPNGAAAGAVRPWFGPFRTRSMVKVQSGCSQACAYCVVPGVRGPEMSLSPSTVLDEVRKRAEEGCKEVVITGTRVGSYQHAGGLEGLLRLLLAEAGIPRIRVSSLQPHEITPSLIALWRDNERLCRHFHLALQSGSASVLRRMGRPYSLEQFEEAIIRLRSAMPRAAITTDVIVGFPGETENDFDETIRFCRKMEFARLHAFPYSPRAGTRAAAMSGAVADTEKRRRVRELLSVGRESAGKFRRGFLGLTMPVLWEERRDDGTWIGHTDNYIPVVTESEQALRGCLTDTRLMRECDQGLWGTVAEKADAVCPAAEGE